MPFSHIALCLLACLLWSGNFVAVKFGLDAHMTPFLLTASRFAVASCLLPFVPRPRNMRMSAVAMIGLIIGVGQFGLATLSVAAGLSAGLVALVLQTQVFLTLGLAAGLLGEAVTRRLLLGSTLSLSGILLLVIVGSAGATQFSVAGLALAVGAATAAAFSNILIKQWGRDANPLQLAVWISPFPILPLLGLSVLTERAIFPPMSHGQIIVSLAVVAYGGLVSAIGGTAIWAWLLHRHRAAQVASLTVAIPVFAFALSALFFGQRLEPAQGLAACLVIAGLLVAFAPSPHLASRFPWLRTATSSPQASLATRS